MQHLRVSWCVLTAFLPAGALADDIDVPELGVRLNGMPDWVQMAPVAARADGFAIIGRAGDAQLEVYREEASASGDVASPRYRAQLDERFDPTVDSRDQGAPTSVGGYNAWTVVATHPQGTGTRYVCITYVIADRHLYRFAVSAAGGEHRPAEFDFLVRVLSRVKFEPVRRAPPPDPPAGDPARADPGSAPQ